MSCATPNVPLRHTDTTPTNRAGGEEITAFGRCFAKRWTAHNLCVCAAAVTRSVCVGRTESSQGLYAMRTIGRKSADVSGRVDLIAILFWSKVYLCSFIVFMLIVSIIVVSIVWFRQKKVIKAENGLLLPTESVNKSRTMRRYSNNCYKSTGMGFYAANMIIVWSTQNR